MILSKKQLVLFGLVMWVNTHYAMLQKIDCNDDLKKFAGCVVAYNAVLLAPQGYIVKHSDDQANTYAFIDNYHANYSEGGHIIRILLPKKPAGDNRQCFVLTNNTIQRMNFVVRHVDAQDKKSILNALKAEQAEFSRAFERTKHTKNSKIILSLVE